jgi:flagellar basal-body rod modification protein FlgD
MSVGNVSAVTGVASANSPQKASSTSVPSTVNYNQFLQLLVAELKNQDPTNPTDPTQFMSQLASFSSVEQQVRTNSTLESLLSSQATSLLGRTVTSSDGSVSGTVASLQTGNGGTLTATLSGGGAVVIAPGVRVSSQ